MEMFSCPEELSMETFQAKMPLRRWPSTQLGDNEPRNKRQGIVQCGHRKSIPMTTLGPENSETELFGSAFAHPYPACHPSRVTTDMPTHEGQYCSNDL